MARNEEKAQSMLNRWLAYKRSLTENPKEELGRRPRDPKVCGDLKKAEAWRMQLVREIGKKVVEIQNESLGEVRIRDLNDRINQLIREKDRWERRILELGGPNYKKFDRVADDSVEDKSQMVEGSAFRYFGCAKNLPEAVKLEKEKKQKKIRKQDYRGLDCEYYGMEDDEQLRKIELEAERKIFQEIIDLFPTKQFADRESKASPTPDMIEKEKKERQQKELLDRYVSPNLQQSLLKKKEELQTVIYNDHPVETKKAKVEKD